MVDAVGSDLEIMAAGGELGVTRAYDILKDEMVRVMKLIGCNSIRDLDRTYVKRH